MAGEIVRLPDWRGRLIAYLGAARGQGFAYGQLDCALFAAGAVEAMTGVDLAAPYRGTYASQAEGRQLMRQAGHASHFDLVQSVFAEVPVAFAQAGDLAKVVQGAQAGLGIVQGDRVYVATPAGLGLVDLTDAVQAWRV